MSHLQGLINKGWTLDVRLDSLKNSNRPFHAMIYDPSDRVYSSHHFLGLTVDDAIDGLDRYVATLRR
jgi:hypothetical protein